MPSRAANSCSSSKLASETRWHQWLNGRPVSVYSRSGSTSTAIRAAYEGVMALLWRSGRGDDVAAVEHAAGGAARPDPAQEPAQCRLGPPARDDRQRAPRGVAAVTDRGPRARM